MENITNLRQSFANASAETRDALAKQFEPLVNKIVAQMHKKLKTDWNTLKSMAYEGFVIALNTYQPERSNMTFTQFAAFAILNNIRNCSCTELHTVKLTSYTQEQIRQASKDEETPSTSTFATVSISAAVSPSGDNDNYSREIRYGIYESAKFANGDPLVMLEQEVNDNCNKTDAYCFFSYFGVCGYEEKPVIELAKELNVSSGRISQRIKRVTEFIKGNELLCESLASLLEK